MPITPSTCVPTNIPSYPCHSDCASGFLGLMFYMPCVDMNPGCSIILPEHVYKDFIAWATADSDNKFLISSDGTGKYSALSNWSTPEGEYAGTIIQDQDGVPNYVYLQQEEDQIRFVWSFNSPSGGGCDCEPIPEQTILEICSVEY